MIRDGIPFKEYILPKRLHVGIQYQSSEGLVPEIEEREAAVYTNTPFHIWKKLSWQERSSSVAHYRMHLMIEAHINDAEYQHMKRQEAKNKAKGRHR